MTQELLIAFGALGLILLGMDWMSNGLKTATGPKFLAALEHWTTTPRRGVLFGTTATIAVQSSSAITVATIGFVNAGVLPLERAAFVIYGSNVGTSLTGWFIALVGIELKIDAFALPLLGFGALLKLFSSSAQRRGLGEALIGFAALFLGLSYLKTGFDASGISLDFAILQQGGIVALLIAVLIGTVLTTLMQASVAVIALVLTAVSTTGLDLTIAAGFVIGANLGTTSTAIMSTLAATANAKRLAWLHVLFNVVTALVAVLLVAPILNLIAWLEQSLAISSTPAVSLALFHSLFNVLGVCLLWPMTKPLVRWLNRRFTEKPSQLKYVDANSLLMPDTALRALTMEQLEQISQLLQHVLPLSRGIKPDEKALQPVLQTQKQLADFLRQLGQSTLSARQSRLMVLLSNSQLRIETVLQLIPKIDLALGDHNDHFKLEVALWQTLAEPDYKSVEFKRVYRNYLKGVELQKQAIYRHAVFGQLNHSKASQLLLAIHELKRMNIQMLKAFAGLRKALQQSSPSE